jgi:2-dehydro-3-deoxyphosphogluconate aldolase/(4S)-4-hydroxy-2-oxoglutarate aldolase
MPQVPFVPTGGISAEDAPQWLAAGAIAVGVGGSLTSGDPASIADRARLLARACAAGPATPG